MLWSNDNQKVVKNFIGNELKIIKTLRLSLLFIIAYIDP